MCSSRAKWEHQGLPLRGRAPMNWFSWSEGRSGLAQWLSPWDLDSLPVRPVFRHTTTVKESCGFMVPGLRTPVPLSFVDAEEISVHDERTRAHLQVRHCPLSLPPRSAWDQTKGLGMHRMSPQRCPGADRVLV